MLMFFSFSGFDFDEFFLKLNVILVEKWGGGLAQESEKWAV